MSVLLYTQTKDYTCGPSSAMMILSHFKKIKKMSAELESQLWRGSRLFPFFATYPHGLANVMAAMGLRVSIVREIRQPAESEFNVFFNFEEIPEKLRKETLRVFKRNNKAIAAKSKKLGVKFILKEPSLKMIEECLKQGELVMALVAADYFHKYHRHYSKGQIIPHWVLITKIDDFVHINDPTAGKIRFSREEFENLMKLLSKRFKIKPALICVGKR